MKRTINGISAAAIIAVFMCSCAKSENEPDEPPTGGGNGPVPGFTWTPAGGQAIKADEFYYVDAFNNIVASKNAGSKIIDINLSGLSVGSYSISSSTGNTFEYVSDNSSQMAASGVVKITAVLNNKITGNFNAAFTNGPVTGISGQFIDLQPK